MKENRQQSPVCGPDTVPGGRLYHACLESAGAGRRNVARIHPRRGIGAVLVRAVGLFACVLLAVSCSKEPAGEETGAADGRRVEIAPSASLPQGAAASATRAVADPSKEMELWFVRADEAESGTWGAWGASALRGTRAAGTGETGLSFEQVQYYPVNNLKAGMAGWYPGGATAVGDPSGKGYYDPSAGTVAWTIDGSQDILTAPLTAGSKWEAMPVIAFGHALSQVQVYVYADTKAAAKWGELKSVQLLDQSNICTLKLSEVTDTEAPVAFTGGKTPFTVPSDAPLTLPEGDRSKAVAFGQSVMIAPQSSADYRLTLALHTAGQGTVRVDVAPCAYQAGQAVKIYVRFTKLVVKVEPTITITDWVSGENKVVTIK